MIGARYDLYNPNADASQQRAANLVPVNRVVLDARADGDAPLPSGARLLLEYDINRNPLGVGAERRADDARGQRADAARAAGVLMRALLCPSSRSCVARLARDRVVLAACRRTPGADAYMQIPGAQFVRGPMPQGSASGPARRAD